MKLYRFIFHLFVSIFSTFFSGFCFFSIRSFAMFFFRFFIRSHNVSLSLCVVSYSPSMKYSFCFQLLLLLSMSIWLQNKIFWAVLFTEMIKQFSSFSFEFGVVAALMQFRVRFIGLELWTTSRVKWERENRCFRNFHWFPAEERPQSTKALNHNLVTEITQPSHSDESKLTNSKQFSEFINL